VTRKQDEQNITILLMTFAEAKGGKNIVFSNNQNDRFKF